METGVLKKGDTVYSTEISSGVLSCEVLELKGSREQCATVRTATGKTYDVMVSTCSLDPNYQAVDNELSKLSPKNREVGFEIEKKAINEAVKIDSGCYFNNDSIERQKEKAINFQVRFLTDERLCELRKRLGEAYENGRVINITKERNGATKIKYDEVTEILIEKLNEQITVYTKQNFPELIIEE